MFRAESSTVLYCTETTKLNVRADLVPFIYIHQYSAIIPVLVVSSGSRSNSSSRPVEHNNYQQQQQQQEGQCKDRCRHRHGCNKAARHGQER